MSSEQLNLYKQEKSTLEEELNNELERLVQNPNHIINDSLLPKLAAIDIKIATEENALSDDKVRRREGELEEVRRELEAAMQQGRNTDNELAALHLRRLKDGDIRGRAVQDLLAMGVKLWPEKGGSKRKRKSRKRKSRKRKSRKGKSRKGRKGRKSRR